MKEYDIVELIKERPEYTKEGVKAGDFGALYGGLIFFLG